MPPRESRHAHLNDFDCSLVAYFQPLNDTELRGSLQNYHIKYWKHSSSSENEVTASKFQKNKIFEMTVARQHTSAILFLSCDASYNVTFSARTDVGENETLSLIPFVVPRQHDSKNNYLCGTLHIKQFNSTP